MVTGARAGPLVMAGVLVTSIWAGAGAVISTAARTSPGNHKMV